MKCNTIFILMIKNITNYSKVIIKIIKKKGSFFSVSSYQIQITLRNKYIFVKNWNFFMILSKSRGVCMSNHYAYFIIIINRKGNLKLFLVEHFGWKFIRELAGAGNQLSGTKILNLFFLFPHNSCLLFLQDVSVFQSNHLEGKIY